MAVKPVPSRELRRRSLLVVAQTANTLIEQLRWNYSAACQDDPILAMVLLGRLESATRIKAKLCEIVTCLEVAS